LARANRWYGSTASPRFELRLKLVATFMFVALAGIGARLYYLQIVSTKQLSELADRNRIRTLRVAAPRGLVFDRHHRVLVDTRPSFDAVMVPEDSTNLTATIKNLERYLGGDHFADKVAEAEDEGRPAFEPITVKERLDWGQIVALETHQLELPGVSLEVTPRRHYLYGSLAAHLLGYVGEVNRQDLAKLPDYHVGDEIGRFGLERGLENSLRGAAGGRQIEVDAVGRRLRVLGEVPEQPGRNVILTIDFDVQQAAEQALGSRTGAVVALDPNNGEIIAMASHPSFDPNSFSGGINLATWRSLSASPDHPLEDRAIQGVYPPGSTFKLVDSIAALQEKAITPTTVFNCPGGLWYGNREYRCWRKEGHGDVALHRAIVQSCDVYFYEVGLRLGVDRLAYWADQLGLGRHSGVPLGEEKVGLIPSSAWKRKRFGERWYPAETLSVAIGQGYVGVTPLQMAQLAAEIANGGIRYQPHFVRQIIGADGRVLENVKPVVEARLKVDPNVLAMIRDAMADVVNGAGGTAHRAQLEHITVCGKTGTAQVVKEAQGDRVKEENLPERYRDHGWFVAFAPKEQPQIAVACVIEHGGHGGSSAAPVVHDVMAKFFELYPPKVTPAAAKLQEALDSDRDDNQRSD
jgi:penicillin-binding protein 2